METFDCQTVQNLPFKVIKVSRVSKVFNNIDFLNFLKSCDFLRQILPVQHLHTDFLPDFPLWSGNTSTTILRWLDRKKPSPQTKIARTHTCPSCWFDIVTAFPAVLLQSIAIFFWLSCTSTAPFSLFQGCSLMESVDYCKISDVTYFGRTFIAKIRVYPVTSL